MVKHWVKPKEKLKPMATVKVKRWARRKDWQTRLVIDWVKPKAIPKD